MFVENYRKYAAHILNAWNSGNDERFDANETASFARMLEYVRTQTYDVEYPDLKARQLIPLDTSVPPGAETVTYRQWDRFGLAKIISNYADDLPKVGILGKEFTGKIRSIGVAYGYTIQDVRAAQMQKLPLEAAKGKAAREEIEYLIDVVTALGDSTHGLIGFLKHPNVPLVTPITGTWGSATSAQILADLNKLVNSVVENTKERRIPTTIALPLAKFNLLASTYVSGSVQVETILSVFLKTTPYVKEVVPWSRCDSANAANNGARAVCYAKDPSVVQMIEAQPFEQMPPQAKGLAFEVPCHARLGGVEVRYPLGMAYMDGI